MAARAKDKTYVADLINSYNKEVRNLITYCITLTYFMRGSIQYERMLEMTYAEREIIDEFLKKRFDIESKNMYPTY